MLRRVAVVRTDVSEETGASFIRVTRIGELGTTLAVTSNRRTQSAEEWAPNQKKKIIIRHNLVMGPRVVPDTAMDWPAGRRS
jgi:hypothetical protein